MPFKDIKKSILEDAKKSADQIMVEGQKKAEEARQEWEKKAELKRKEIVAAEAAEIQQKIRQAEFKAQIEARAEILKKKQAIMDRVYFLAMEKLAKLSDGDYIKLMEKLIGELPLVRGELLSAEGKKSQLKKALDLSKRKYVLGSATIKSRGGFAFKSEKFEINRSFEDIIKELENKTVLSTAEILFKE